MNEKTEILCLIKAGDTQISIDDDNFKEGSEVEVQLLTKVGDYRYEYYWNIGHIDIYVIPNESDLEFKITIKN